MTDRAALLDDLRDEGDELDRLVAGLNAAGWALATPADGWTIAHQVAHLAWTDRLAILAVHDPETFTTEAVDAGANPQTVDEGAAAGAARHSKDLLADWRDTRLTVLEVLAAVPDDAKIPWFGPPMKPASMATARMMETFAHGQDIADTLHAQRPPTARLRHVAHIGVRTRDYAFQVNALAPPTEPFRVELAGPAGELWTWGPQTAAQRVTGPARDFCLLVTRRRHRADLAVRAHGEDADRWLDIAQAFAGPPGPGRAPEGRTQ